MLRLDRLGYETDGAGGDTGLFPDCRGEGDLEPGAEGGLSFWDHPSA